MLPAAKSAYSPGNKPYRVFNVSIASASNGATVALPSDCPPTNIIGMSACTYNASQDALAPETYGYNDSTWRLAYYVQISTKTIIMSSVGANVSGKPVYFTIHTSA
jgi:hypothetical protein